MSNRSRQRAGQDQDRQSVTRRAISPKWVLFCLCAGAFLSQAAPAAAQGRLDAQYEASLSGIPVGRGSWTIEVGDATFAAAAHGGTSGLLKAFSGGTGTGASQGRVVNGALVPSAYTATTTTSNKSETIRLALLTGTIKEFSIAPEPPVDADRIVVTEAHRKNVFDPMTGSMLRAPANMDPLSPDVCRTGA